MTTLRWLVAAMIASLIGIAVTPAFAGPKDEARQLARRGFELFERGAYELALDHFTRADASFHAPTLTLMIARTQVARGMLLDALSTYRVVVDEPLDADAPAAFAEAKERARTELSALSARIPRIRIRVSGQVPGQRITATVDGKAVDDVRAPIQVDPGPHTVVVAHDASEGRTFDVRVVESETKDVAYSIAAIEPPLLPVETADEDSTSPLLIPAVVALFVGAAGVAMGIGAGVVALEKADELQSRCDVDRRCDPEDEEIQQTGQINETLSTVGLIVGGIGVATGVTLLVISSLDNTETARVAVTPSSISIVGRF